MEFVIPVEFWQAAREKLIKQEVEIYVILGIHTRYQQC